MRNRRTIIIIFVCQNSRPSAMNLLGRLKISTCRFWSASLFSLGPWWFDRDNKKAAGDKSIKKSSALTKHAFFIPRTTYDPYDDIHSGLRNLSLAFTKRDTNPSGAHSFLISEASVGSPRMACEPYGAKSFRAWATCVSRSRKDMWTLGSRIIVGC